MRTLPDQFLSWEGLYNLRELGGYATADGHLTRSGLLFRSEAFFRLPTDSRRELFDELGLVTVIDLRSDRERHDQGYLEEAGDTKLLHFPLLDVSVDSGLDRGDPDYLPKAYQAILKSRPASLGDALTIILDPSHWPLLFHCAAGKDRTGIVAMLALSAADVPHDLIAKDYALTQLALERVLAANDPNADPARWRELPTAVIGSSPRTAQVTLDFIDQRFGSTQQYLEELGVAGDLVSAFKDHFTAA
ncbi:tyrosine-protein phosphatase [Ferrimicrobium sp.]|uniref:tyrosine-protein phosphatase n=1 Tax=Ferrimicrobium sp. TaxID=2926050 RepID=UPI002619047C|nr:tyrosine-protein phosphatase [Ferrimicrobium sp.]